jgi:acyl-CoA synthetase (NDP forming)
VAIRAAAALARGTRGRQRAGSLPSNVAAITTLPDPLRQALAAARRRPQGALTEEEASRLLGCFGVPTLPARLVGDSVGAARAAEEMGFPVVLKVHSAERVHKSDVGGVHLDLRNRDEVLRAFEAIAGLSRGEPEARLTPFMGGGILALVGGRRDPVFGEILVLGVGGTLAEAVGDVSIRLAPCADQELRGMVEETRLGSLLARPRGEVPVPPDVLMPVLRSLERLLLSVPEVADVEVNPVRCGPEGVVALDARVLVSR